MTNLPHLLTNESGATVLEYSIISFVISLATISATVALEFSLMGWLPA